MVTADHGPAVSGAHNTIVCARAGKDLISSLASGLLTIVSVCAYELIVRFISEWFAVTEYFGPMCRVTGLVEPSMVQLSSLLKPTTLG